MAETAPEQSQTEGQETALEGGDYEIIRQRLLKQGEVLRERMDRLDARRREVFGSVELGILKADRVSTEHNCVPRDMIQLGQGRFLFGFNVRFGLKETYALSDVFAIYEYEEAEGVFREHPLDPLKDPEFEETFQRLYKVYGKASFTKFTLKGSTLYMVFRTGDRVDDISVFKWEYHDGQLTFVDDRSDGEYKKQGFPDAYNFTWRHPPRDAFRSGDHPHVSIEDKVFVECVGGDLTIKVEDNTRSGGGIYAEAVENRNQKVDDAEYQYAIQGSLVILKVKPFQEKEWRYFIYNEKMQEVHRVDSIAHACVMLPEEHGVIFPDGYYLQTGELKRFEGSSKGMVLERIVASPNGEDTLYVFFDRMSGTYALMPYRLIQQEVPERITCSGFSTFNNGHMISFRSEDEAQKHHMVQVWQTPFYVAGFEPESSHREDFLFQVQNKPVVRCLAEAHEVLTLILKENPYADLYADMARRAQAIPDSYAWLNNEAGCEIVPALADIRESAEKAVAEFDKVRRLKREASERVVAAQESSQKLFNQVQRAAFHSVDDFVVNLGGLRTLRGELISLKETRYVDLSSIEALEAQVVEQNDKLSERCVQFLLQPEAMDPYTQRAEEQQGKVEGVTKVAEAKELEGEVQQTSEDLEMLIRIVNSLKIDDTTEQTRIVESITAIFTTVNQVKEALKKKSKSLMAEEGAAQFDAQMKLLSQSAVNALDMSDTPEKCTEYYNSVIVQLEDLEGAFADFDEYIEELTGKRLELEEAFEQKRLQLVEARNRKAAALVTSAERMLKSVEHKLGTFDDINEINGYMASDLIIEKIRDVIKQLLELDKAGEAEGLQSQMKSQHEESVRQLKDKKELFVDGQNVIQFGQHKFAVNTQPLDLTIVRRGEEQCMHLTGTQYFAPITNEEFLATRAVWDQEVISENREVYRAEYLAYLLWKKIVGGESHGLEDMLEMDEAKRLKLVQSFMSDRYAEAYTKGIHDQDGEKILHTLLTTHEALQLARYLPRVRACAAIYWNKFCPEETQNLWATKLQAFAKRNALFPGDPVQQEYIEALTELVQAFVVETSLFDEADAADAGEYLFYEVVAGKEFAISQEADKLLTEFERHLAKKGSEKDFRAALLSLKADPASQFQLVRDWVRGFLLSRNGENKYLDEIAALVLCNLHEKQAVVKEATGRVVEGLQGAHRVVDGNSYDFDYLSFQERLAEFERESVPRFEAYQQIKQNLMDQERVAMRLDEFEPKVLTSFVRSELIDKVYLPIVGDNLAKQVGATGEDKRTDLMGLLLLVSPPGYGKTTLMEYLANRLGLVFMKINGPALGHEVTSLDPEDAPNAGAREEVTKLNLSLEMGDNVMIYLDDIQHCNPEFLQKFISLCDAQRRIEGVWRGRPRTYDLRGRRVVVVMAGNPYTESGDKFRIPDMLANRADTYNLGDMSRENESAFNGSYLENAITSNPVLKPLSNKSQKDIQAFIRIAETGVQEGVEFEGNYSAQESGDIISVLEKMIVVRDVVLKVNQLYIESAGQADEFRTEPAFKMQGSYRNMNRMAEKIRNSMIDEEVQDLIIGHYEGESQTLTTGAEANMLKFRELIGVINEEEKERWEEIRKTYGRNQFLQGADQGDPVGRVVSQLSLFQGGLESIEKTLSDSLTKPRTTSVDLGGVSESLDALRETVSSHLQTQSDSPQAESTAPQFEAINENLSGLRASVESYLSHAPQQVATGQPASAAPDTTPQFLAINENLNALRGAVEAYLSREPQQPEGAATADYLEALATHMNEGLGAIRTDFADALQQMQSSQLAGQVTAMQNSLTGLRDVLAQNRARLKEVHEKLRAAEPEVVMEFSEEMIGDNEALLKAISDQIQQLRDDEGEDQSPEKSPKG